MQLGTYVDGQPLNYDEQTGVFAVGGWTIPPDRVQTLSDAGKMSWASDEIRTWFYSTFVPAPPPEAIPAETPEEPSTSKRATRPGVPAMVAAAVVVVALIVGAVLWINFTRSPGYSLGQLANAVQKKDWDGVQKYVDIESVTNQLVDGAMSKALEGDTSGFGALAAGFAQAMKPALVQQAKEAFRKSIEQGGGNGGGLDSAAGLLAAKKIKSITYIGDEALVTIQVPDGDKTFDLKLRMKRVDNFWRVTAIENFLDLPGASAP